jgi:hypothetical protein
VLVGTTFLEIKQRHLTVSKQSKQNKVSKHTSTVSKQRKQTNKEQSKQTNKEQSKVNKQRTK